MATVQLRNTRLGSSRVDQPLKAQFAMSTRAGATGAAPPPISARLHESGIQAFRGAYGWDNGIPYLDLMIRAIVYAFYDVTGDPTDASAYVLKAGKQPPRVNFCHHMRSDRTQTGYDVPSGSALRANPAGVAQMVRWWADPSFRDRALLTSFGSADQVPQAELYAMPPIRLFQIESGNEPGGHEGFEPALTRLNGAMSIGATTITVDSTAGFTTAALVINDHSQRPTYTSKTATQFLGVSGVVAAAPDNATVTQVNFLPMWTQNWLWYCSHFYYYWKAIYETIEAGWGSWWPTAWGWPRFSGFSNVQSINVVYTDPHVATHFPGTPANNHTLYEHHAPYWLESKPWTQASPPAGILAPGAAGSDVRIIDILTASKKPDGSPETNSAVRKGAISFHRYGGPDTTSEALEYAGTGLTVEGQALNPQLAMSGMIDNHRRLLDAIGGDPDVVVDPTEQAYSAGATGTNRKNGRTAYTAILDIALQMNRADELGDVLGTYNSFLADPTPTASVGFCDTACATLLTPGRAMRDMVATLKPLPLFADIGVRGFSAADFLVSAWCKDDDGLTAIAFGINLDGITTGTSHAHTFAVPDAPQGLTASISRWGISHAAPVLTSPTFSTITVTAGATQWTDTLAVGEAVFYLLTFVEALPGSEPPPPPASYVFAGNFSVPSRIRLQRPGLDGCRSIPRRLGILNIGATTSSDAAMPAGGVLRDVPSDTLLSGVQLRDVPIYRPIPPPPPEDP